MADTEVGVADVQISGENKKAENGVAHSATEKGIACELAPAEDYHTTKRDAAVKIRFSGNEGDITNTPAISVMEYVKRAMEKFPDRIAMKVEREGRWISWTYREYMQEIRTVGKAFIKLGLEPYHGVGILGFNSPEWVFSDLGAIFAGGLATGIYTTNNPEACQFVCADAGCNIVVVENDVQLQKILQVWDQLPELKAIVQYTGEVKDKKPNIYNWNEFMEIGRSESDEQLEERINAQAPNKCCTLIYTSGTTGNPKGVMLSHDNVIMGSLSILDRLLPVLDPKGTNARAVRSISYLPLSHIAAQITDIYLPYGYGAEVWFARPDALKLTDIFMPIYACAEMWFAKPDALKGTLVDTLQAARPTLFVGVPRVYEKMEEKLKSVGATITGVKKKVSTWAKGVALTGNRNKEKGLPVPFGWTIATTLLKKVHKNLGLDQCKMVFTAAAPISRSTCEYFQSLNLPLHEVYGMSEASGMTHMCTSQYRRITSIGPVCKITSAKIVNADEDGAGELWFQGRNVFMGYLNNEEKTKESIDEDGWLHSGDVGKADKDDFYYITGRIKEIIITAGGENIAPVPIEDHIKAELPLVASAMVIGDKRKFLSCLLTLQVEVDIDTGLPTDKLLPVAVHYLSKLGLNVTKAQEIAPDVPDVLRKAIQEGIDKANKKAVSNAARSTVETLENTIVDFEHVQKWKLLPLEFTVSGGELGPTQKLRRPHVMKMYKETIDEFYAV